MTQYEKKVPQNQCFKQCELLLHQIYYHPGSLIKTMLSPTEGSIMALLLSESIFSKLSFWMNSVSEVVVPFPPVSLIRRINESVKKTCRSSSLWYLDDSILKYFLPARTLNISSLIPRGIGFSSGRELWSLCKLWL